MKENSAYTENCTVCLILNIMIKHVYLYYYQRSKKGDFLRCKKHLLGGLFSN